MRALGDDAGPCGGALVAGHTTKPNVDDPFWLVGHCLDGKYAVRSMVAEGGFGVVYRAEHLTLQKTVALKVLKVPEELSPAMREGFLEKFADEARTIARLEHPSIVRVIDFGASTMSRGGTAPWMVLEWLDGVTLEEELSRRGAGHSPADALALLKPVFEAMAFAHDEGVAHRDLKPANLMLVRNRRGEVSLRVLDFGIAKVADAGVAGPSGMTATQSALKAFSPVYAAPEQVSGTRTGPWTDVHALALIVVEALLGRPAYNAEDTTLLYADILSPTRPTPAKFHVDVGAWEPVLAQALAMLPAQRFPDARAFLNALEQALPGATWAARGSLPTAVDPMGASTTLRPHAVVTAPAAGVAPSAPRRRAWVGLGAGALAVVAVAAGFALRSKEAPPRALAGSIAPARVETAPTVAAPTPAVVVASVPAAPTVEVIPSQVDAGAVMEPVVAAPPQRAVRPVARTAVRPRVAPARGVAPVVAPAAPAAPRIVRPSEVLVE